MTPPHSALAAAAPVEVPFTEVPRSRASAALLLTLVAVALFGIRLAGHPNYLDNEYRLGAFVLNAIQGGNWIAPHDLHGHMYKPPMLTWLSALVSLPTGHVSPFSLYLPTACATLATAWLVFASAEEHFGRQSGLFGALAYLLSYAAFHQMGTARWDGLFAFTVALTAIAGFRASTSGRGWTGFWLAAAAATLTKGPLGVLLAGFGFLAALWERPLGRWRPWRGSHALGVALFLLITIGWFGAAYHVMGSRFLDDLFRDEFVGHIVMHAPGHRFWKVPNDALTNFLPWSILSVVGVWRTVRFPAEDERVRRFERFCVCWLVATLLLFAISPHNPSRLLDPLYPPAAILAGRELARLARRLGPRRRTAACAAVIACAVTGLAAQAHHFERRSHKTKQTVAMFDLRRTVRAAVGGGFPLTYAADVPFAAQLAFDDMRPPVSYREAAALLRDPAPAYVVVRNVARLRRALRHGSASVHEVASSSVGGVPYLRIVGNREALAWSDPLAVGIGRLRIVLHDARLGPTQDGRITVARVASPASVTVANAGREAARLVVDVGSERAVRQLGPGETVELAVH